MNPATIAAVATPAGRGGIGIVKISGPAALGIAAAIFQPSDASFRPRVPEKFRADDFQSHRLYYGHIVEPGSSKILDEVLLAAMKAPHSYTKEDVVEINAHGGPAALEAILRLVIARGARLAEPGEFTRRAFLNGRIDLAQAEAVIDIVNARTEKFLRLAAAQVGGRLSRQVAAVRKVLIDLLARLEAAIDFPEDMGGILDSRAAAAVIQEQIIDPLQRLVRDYPGSRVLRDGFKVAVVGRPNVGKSSLLNLLVQKERAIVTAIPGTTRDVIEETLNLEGIPVMVSDTAGLQASADLIETLGMAKTLEHVRTCDLVLFMIEAQRPLTAADQRIYDQVNDRPLIVVVNKIDLVADKTMPVVPKAWQHQGCIHISALYDRGVDALKAMVAATARGGVPADLEDAVIVNLRHKTLLDKSLATAAEGRRVLQEGAGEELAAIHIKEAVAALGEIIGESVSVDVLEQIFSQFCIGK